MANHHKTMGGMIAIGAAAGGAIMIARAILPRSRGYDFRNKVVLITGGSRGLGLVIARQLAAQGARIAICARHSEELEIAGRDIRASGGDVLTAQCDLSRREQARRMVGDVLSHFGRIDVLINNAGTITVGPIESMRLEDYHYSMDTIFWPAVHTAYYVAPHMQHRRTGRIVNIGSVGGKIGVPHLTTYCAAKFAVTGWSRALTGELRKDGVLVTTISPGLMRTGSPRNAEFKGRNTEEYAWFKISDSLPVLSMNAERAAHQVIEAARRGAVDVVLGMPARLAVTFDQLLPGISGDLTAVAGKLLPEMGGIGTEKRRGAESETERSESFLTELTDDAARRNNELVR